ncbi:hypothetical protein P280DRAFT_514443 [Massarina eburnea CBS 473.64]|uniref:DUF3669 domain-containing protein n=1 Tax=Massarina eburnea CBS 473.64 TaxID=1395130 RepID=A0A6A6SFG3_9PLEO|nr:hypothetical protein P280DRAFT_514443 [Massarina eburnea CBS 473.64]
MDLICHCIGRGDCGSVWAFEGDHECYKREDGGTGRSIVKDQIMHRRVLQRDPPACIQVPQSFGIAEHTDTIGRVRFPDGSTAYRKYHRMERIPAMPKAVRQKLIDMYCPEELQDLVATNRDDEDCLVRPYVGRRRASRQVRLQRFSLRNYPLHVNQMEELGLDTHALARILADALAHCHWVAQIDANGIEFVLAPTSAKKENPEPSLFEAFDGKFAVWMFDYDFCRPMSQDEAGVDEAVHAFYRNDPYYPRPFAYGYTDEDASLWKTFRTRFLETSRRIFGQRDGVDGVRLATLLIEKIEEEGRRKSKRASRDTSEF